MEIQPGTTIKWKHPDNDEVYTFSVDSAEHHGCGHWTLTLKDGRLFEVWEYEILEDDPYEVTVAQVNPEPELEPSTGKLP